MVYASRSLATTLLATTFVFLGCTNSGQGGTSPTGGNAGRQVAPSTAAANKYGYLFNRCRFTADAATLTNKIYLGRSWDQNVSSAGDWNASTSPNGQAVIRESELGAHIRLADPGAAAATSGRAYDAITNRFYEYCNTGPGAG